MKYNSKRDLKPEYPFDRDDIDNLEGITIDFENDDEYIDGMIGKADNTDETDVRVVDALKSKVDVWKQFGAGGMVVQVITKGLRLNCHTRTCCQNLLVGPKGWHYFLSTPASQPASHPASRPPIFFS